MNCKFIVHSSTSFSTTRTSVLKQTELLSCRRSDSRLRHSLMTSASVVFWPIAFLFLFFSYPTPHDCTSPGASTGQFWSSILSRSGAYRYSVALKYPTECGHLYSETWAIVSSHHVATVCKLSADTKEPRGPWSFCSSGGAAVYSYTGKLVHPPAAPHLTFWTVVHTSSQVTRPALLSFFPNLGITENVAGLFRFCAWVSVQLPACSEYPWCAPNYWFGEYCKIVHFWPAFCLGCHLLFLPTSLASLGGSHGKLRRVDAEATWSPKWRKTKKPRADRGRRAIDGWSTETMDGLQKRMISAAAPPDEQYG